MCKKTNIFKEKENWGMIRKKEVSAVNKREEESTEMTELLQIINAKGDVGEIEEILKEHEQKKEGE